MRALTCLLPSQWMILAVGLWAMSGITAPIAAQGVPSEGMVATPAPSMGSYTTSGSYFNRELGTPLRFSYHSEGYGTEVGVVGLGTMKVFNLDGATWFLDGQGTMSDDFGGGFNAGIGYRELVDMGRGFDPERVLGASFWTDGQNTKADNFFTQLGFGLESLGESFDLRMNGYFPLERTKESDPTLVNFNTPVFQGNNLFLGQERIITDTAFSVVDAEAAKRIGNLDAWALAAVYYLGGAGGDETGYRVGVRGYAVPDLLVGVEVTDDDIYETNVMATLTWFVGRTHTGNAPLGTIEDRFREPVMRNNFVSTRSSQTIQGAGEALRDADTGEILEFVFANSNAAPGGDGTFENPTDTLTGAQGFSDEDDFIIGFSNSTFSDGIVLQDGQRFFGFGDDRDGNPIVYQVDTNRGIVTLPEISTGSRPIIDGPATAITLADNNEVEGWIIRNVGTGVLGNGINAPQLANLTIGETGNPVGTGIRFENLTGTTVVENTVDIFEATNFGMQIIGGNSGMNIAANITNTVGTSLLIEDRTGGTVAFGGSIQDDNAVASTAESIIIRDNQNATINFTQQLDLADDLGININSGNFNALLIENNEETTTITFADLLAESDDADTVHFSEGGTLTINDSGDDSGIINTGTGDAFHHDASAVATQDSTITVAANINNSGGGEAVEIIGHTENNITFSGTITDTGSNGIVLTNNTGGTIAFNDDVDITSTGAGNGVTITGGGSGVTYRFADIDITTDTGTAFSATGDGTLIVTSADGTNSIQTASGTAVNLDGLNNGLTIGTGGAIFDTVNVTNGTTASAIVARDLDGAQVRFGSGAAAGAGGTIGTNQTGITIDDANNVAITNVTINKTGAGDAVIIQDQQAGSSVTGTGVVITADTTGNGLVIGSAVAGEENVDGLATFNDLTVTTADGDAVSVIENEGGVYGFNDLDAETTGSGDVVVVNNNSDDTTVSFSNMDVDATGTGAGFVATNGGVVAASGTNSISTTTGTAVNLSDIESGGITIGEVDTTGATNAVIVNNVTDGVVNIGSTGATSTLNTTGDAIQVTNSTNVVITNVDITGAGGRGVVADHDNDQTNTLTLNDVTVAATKTHGIVSTHSGTVAYTLNITNSVFNAVDGAGEANTFTHTGSGAYTVNISNTDFEDAVVMTGNGSGTFGTTIQNGSSFQTAGTEVALQINLEAPVSLANIRIQNNEFDAIDANAFDLNINSTNSKTVNFLFNQNLVANNSAAATVEVDATGATILNATVVGNNVEWANAGAGVEFDIAANSGNTVVNLNLDNNNVNGGFGDYVLRELNGSSFGIQNRDTVEARNQGNFTYDSPNGLLTDFTDIASVPTPP